MSINNKFIRIQQHNIRNQLKNSDLNTFFNLLNIPDLSTLLEETQPNHRKRIYSPSATLSMYLTQTLSSDSSCQNIVNVAAINRMKAGLPLGSTLTGGYCRARQRLPIKMVSSLVYKAGQLTEILIPKQWRWHGKRVHLIDGTTLTMPDTKENQAVYPQQSGQKPGLGFPICRIVGVICLSSGTILNAAIGQYKGKGGSEQSLLRQLLSTFNAGDLIIGDALYGSYFLLSALHTHLLPRQLSFKHALQLWLAFSNHDYPYLSETKKTSLFALIAQRKIGNRPGRVEPRAVKRRPKPYPLLMKIRLIAQEEIRQNGHPKKLK